MTITIADGRGALWQWDTGRRVKITDGDGVKQIHYQNRCFGCSVDVDVGDDGTAIIPDELLQDWHPLTAYAYVTDDTGAYTMVQQDFAVYKRAKPADYVFTPVEQTTIEQIAAIAQSVRDDADAGLFDGETGATPNIQIGIVETLPAGSQATASMTGTAENPLLNLGIPQGISGSGGGGISVKDDGAGNVEITEIPSGWTVTDDGNGNVVIGG